jgi:hypothetical protein
VVESNNQVQSQRDYLPLLDTSTNQAKQQTNTLHIGTYIDDYGSDCLCYDILMFLEDYGGDCLCYDVLMFLDDYGSDCLCYDILMFLEDYGGDCL